MKKTDQSVRERFIKIASKKGGKPVRIAQVADLHISAVNDEDMACAEIARTYFHRKWLRDGEAIPAAQRTLDACRNADITVITGDLLDYYSGEGARVLKALFDAHPNVMACIGGHDITLEMETDRENELSLDERYALLSECWCNDVQFAGKTLDGKVTLIVLNNNVELYRETRRMFDEEQVRLLRAEVESARREGRIILLFMHEPICPGHDKPVCDIVNGQEVKIPRSPGASNNGYELITSSSDVIRGVFVGHQHSDFECDIEAGYEQDGAYVRQPIPMIGLTANCYCVEGKVGHVLWIEVE